MSSQSADTVETIRKVTGYGSVGFGAAALLTPNVLYNLYGMKERLGEASYMGRMWGTRTAAIGILALAATAEQERRALFLCSATLNAVDAVVALTTPGLSGRTRVLGALTSGGFAAAAIYVLNQ
ncbi:MAG: hypothetical protein QOK15_1615 [Nocardioidaceae bacterium]|jgi:hypothetical protein|nr:hypothetical protein [Nocardioidaceae bacterium]